EPRPRYTSALRESHNKLGWPCRSMPGSMGNQEILRRYSERDLAGPDPSRASYQPRSEEHTSELQSRFDLVCRLLLEKKNNTIQSSLCASTDCAKPTTLTCLPSSRGAATTSRWPITSRRSTSLPTASRTNTTCPQIA